MPENPTVNTYNRLENLPRSENFDRALRAEIRDPLWLLSRQWQFGEFEAEDAGSAVLARISSQTSPVIKYLPEGASTRTKIDVETPIEVLVERETPPMDLVLRMEMGRHFLRLLEKETGNPTTTAAIKAELLAATSPASLKLSLPEEGPDAAYLFSNRRLRQAAAMLAAGDCLDGGALYLYLYASTTRKVSTFLSSPNAAADLAGTALKDWFQRVYSQPGKTETSAYQEDALEYKFALATPKRNRMPDVLRAEGYPGGRLDWYSFDLDTDYEAKLKPTYYESRLVDDRSITVIPTEAMFSAMPKSRWWEFEDGRVNLYGANSDSLNPATIVYNEFALIFSNDWMIVPLTMPLGHLVEVDEIVVRDVFGQQTLVKAAGSDETDDYLRWDMFSLQQTGSSVSGPDYRLFLPQVLDRIQEGKPFESVNFLRDEMANMVWGVENRVPDGLGSSMDGFEAAMRVNSYIQGFSEEEAVAELDNEATIRYKMGGTVPENWIPFVPVHAPKSNREIRLQRSSMPRIVEGLDPERILPRTAILSQPRSPHFLNEEEIPRSGVIVRKSWQRTRWFNGETFTWVGRRKSPGRGEGQSGLEFDQIKDKRG
jgi:hypothetical protein